MVQSHPSLRDRQVRALVRERRGERLVDVDAEARRVARMHRRRRANV